MTRQPGRHRRGGHSRIAIRVLRAIGVPALALVMLAALVPAGASFTRTAVDGANSFAAATLAAPTNLAAVSTCSMPTLVGVSAVSEGASNGSEVSLTRSVGEVGDLVVAIIIAGTSAAPPVSGATPAFTTATSGAASTLLTAHVLYRWISNGSEPTTYTFMPATGRATAVLRVYRNVNATTPFGTAATPWTANSNGTTVTAPSVTTTGASNLVLAVQGVRSGNAAPNFASPTGTALANVTAMTVAAPASSTVTGRVGDIAMAAAGATGDSTVTHASNQYRIGLQIPLLPAPGGGITTTWTTTGVQTWADGYELARINGGVTEATFTIAGRTTATHLDTTAGNGTFTYSLRSARDLWRSAAVTANVTRSC